LDNNNNEIVVSSERYQEASIKFRDAWLEYVDREALVKYEIINMVTILEQDGFTRTQAIKRIINDHKDLRGFSRATIYRELPDDMKNDNACRDFKKIENDADPTYKRLNFSTEISEGININSSNKQSTESQSLKDFRDSKGIKLQKILLVKC